MSTAAGRECWVLEVVRGRDIGRQYELGAGDSLLGNALAGASGLDLADQEASSPRRMAGRQASLAVRGDSLTICDLDSPGGTFVNRQRLLAGQVRPLQPGDLVQVGSVQLEVKRVRESGGQPKTPPQQAPPQLQPQQQYPQTTNGPAGASGTRPGALGFPLTLPGGATVRSWDDFLTLAAQRWALVRDEMTSGRLAEFLRKVQRLDLLPKLDPTKTPDELLDAWLGRLPATRSSAPELDVHPEVLLLRTANTTGTIKQTLRISNVGYRLLRGTVRAEPAAAAQIRIATAFPAGSFVTIDETELPVEIELPDRFISASLGAIVIESNGGNRRIEVRLERPAPVADPGGGPGAPAGLSAEAIDLVALGRPLGERIAALPMARRLWLAPLALLIFRLIVLAAGLIPLPFAAPTASNAEPRLGAIAAVLSVAGLAFGAGRAARGGDVREIAPGAVAGALVGLFLGAVGFALIQSGESVLGSWSRSTPAVLLLWGLLGVALAGLSWLVLPRIEPVPDSGAKPETMR
jgi:hypothetical protein